MKNIIPLYCHSTRESIERRAREIFEQRGCPDGRDLDHWLQAENEHWDSCLADSVTGDPGLMPGEWDSLG
jgi:hypothetical protein